MGGLPLQHGRLDDAAETLAARVAETAGREEINVEQIRIFHHGAPHTPATRMPLPRNS
jgi:hypothetical protein